MTTANSDLDPFQTAVLHELRTHVEQRAHSRWRRRRLVPALSAAAAAVAVTGTVFVTAVHPTPAYAVTKTATGDVTITVHELSNSQGLQSALRADGLDAVVSYTPGVDGDNKLVLRQRGDQSVPPADAQPVPSVVFGTHGLTDEQRAECDIAPGQVAATVQQSDDGYRITIPAASPLQNRFFAITGVDATTMTVSYWASDGKHACLIR